MLGCNDCQSVAMWLLVQSYVDTYWTKSMSWVYVSLYLFPHLFSQMVPTPNPEYKQ